MDNQPASTSTVDLLLQRMHDGDIGARNQLIAAVYESMEHLTHYDAQAISWRAPLGRVGRRVTSRFGPLDARPGESTAWLGT